jgi:hypothetical protein
LVSGKGISLSLKATAACYGVAAAPRCRPGSHTVRAGIFWLRLRLAYGLPAALGVAQEQAAFECRKRLSRRIEADWPRNQHACFAFAVCGLRLRLRFLWRHTSSHPIIDRPARSLQSLQSLQAVPFA